jgi:hypothetical protein
VISFVNQLLNNSDILAMNFMAEIILVNMKFNNVISCVHSLNAPQRLPCSPPTIYSLCSPGENTIINNQINISSPHPMIHPSSI